MGFWGFLRKKFEKFPGGKNYCFTKLFDRNFWGKKMSESNHNMDDAKFAQAIKELIQNILNKLNFQIEPDLFDDLTYLRTSDFYIQIYRELFKKLSIDNDEFFDTLEGLSDGPALQFLIDKLAADILEISLAHIRGENMVNGDMENIFNFLQLTNALLQTSDNEAESAEGPDEDYEDELNKSSSKNKTGSRPMIAEKNQNQNRGTYPEPKIETHK